MTNAINNKSEFSPKEKKEQPLGKRLAITNAGQNIFAADKEQSLLALTTVSDYKDNSPLLNSGQNPEECDASKADSSTSAWSIKIFLN